MLYNVMNYLVYIVRHWRSRTTLLYSCYTAARSHCSQTVHVYDNAIFICIPYENTTMPILFFVFFTLLLSTFWTSRGHTCRPFPPRVSCLQFVSRIGFSNPTARRFFIERR